MPSVLAVTMGIVMGLALCIAFVLVLIWRETRLPPERPCPLCREPTRDQEWHERFCPVLHPGRSEVR